MTSRLAAPGAIGMEEWAVSALKSIREGLRAIKMEALGVNHLFAG